MARFDGDPNDHIYIYEYNANPVYGSVAETDLVDLKYHPASNRIYYRDVYSSQWMPAPDRTYKITLSTDLAAAVEIASSTDINDLIEDPEVREAFNGFITATAIARLKGK